MKLYVPNPQVWVDYFDGVSKGSSNQRGGGRRPRIITVKPPKRKDDQRVSIKAVLPTEQTAAQAKSELEREDINPKDVEKVFQNLTKRRGESTKRKAPTSSSSNPKRQKKAGQKRGAGKSSQKSRGYTQENGDIFHIQ